MHARARSPRLLFTSLAALALAAPACSGGPPPDGPTAESAAALINNAALPEIPSLSRDVSLIQNGQLLRPAIPPMRTSADGRVGVDVKTSGGKVAFGLFRPESLTAPYEISPAGTSILAPIAFLDRKNEASFHAFNPANGTPLDALSHVTVCDPSQQWPTGRRPNPYTCNGSDDCYDLTVIAVYSYEATAGGPRAQLWGTPVTVRVTSPKTASADIASITVGATVAGPIHAVNNFFEPMITADGRLLVGRISDTSWSWTHPGNGAVFNQITDIVYSVYDPIDGLDPCDVNQWHTLSPITYAHDDPLMSGYGISKYPFRDGENNPITPGTDIHGTYPWIDRQGNNLFFTTVDSTNYYADGAAVRTRYPASCVTPGCVVPTTAATIDDVEYGTEMRGVAFTGLWSHGKTVLLDNAMNNIDFGLHRDDEGQRFLALFAPGTEPPGVTPPVGGASGQVRAGTGRDNSTLDVPVGMTENSTFIDSHQNLWNHDPHLQTATPRDVVWTLNTGRGSAEVAFDDYLDESAFIISEMSASLIHAGGYSNRQRYSDGFDRYAPSKGHGFTLEPHVQNAATPVPGSWALPAYGALKGGARIEPTALGGALGKGLWLDGCAAASVDCGDGMDYVDYTIPDQTPLGKNVSDYAWYVGLFVDARFDAAATDTTVRELVKFPDGSRLVLRGRDELGFLDAAGTALKIIALPAGKIAYQAWSHLGLQIYNHGHAVTLYLDGYAYASWSSAARTLFGMSNGAGVSHLYLGGYPGVPAPNQGFRGWIDDFKVIASALSPELACNHARGTLVGLPAAYTGALVGVAAPYPSWAHTALGALLTSKGKGTYPSYACNHDYTSLLDSGVRVSSPPTDGTTATVSIRNDLLFPEGPLVHDLPRPSGSSTNKFCLSCHSSGGLGGLSTAALSYDAATLMHDDHRRQPSQPPRLIFGYAPTGYAGNPALGHDTTSTGESLDQWVYPH